MNSTSIADRARIDTHLLLETPLFEQENSQVIPAIDQHSAHVLVSLAQVIDVAVFDWNSNFVPSGENSFVGE